MDMVIQRWIFCHNRNELVQLYEHLPLTGIHFPDLPDNQPFIVLLDPCHLCWISGSVHQVTGKAEI